MVGVALGAAGLPSLLDLVGTPDLFGRAMRVTEVAFADEIAAAASMLMGQGNERLPLVHVRGLDWNAPPANAAALLRPSNWTCSDERRRAASRRERPSAQREERSDQPQARGDHASARVLALSGGVGGAKLVLGLVRCCRAVDLPVAVNTGDDFEHLGLHVSPDLDTVLYTLAGLSDPVRGWGRAGESWNFMSALAALGGETWFALGDRDLAVHVERTRRLRPGNRSRRSSRTWRRVSTSRCASCR